MTDTRIMLASGTLFDILDPAGSKFTIGDIAYGLGRVCRFAGHTNRFYSVAEHCVHVARLVPVHLARAALLHDGAEAFIGDVTRPLKALLPEYQVIEARIEDALCDRLLADSVISSRGAIHDPLIKQADMAMCVFEARELMPFAPDYWSNIPVDEAMMNRANLSKITCDRPEYATATWLRAWHKYGHWNDQLQTAAAA